MTTQTAAWQHRNDLVDIEFSRPSDHIPQQKSLPRGLTFIQAWLMILSVVVLYLVCW